MARREKVRRGKKEKPHFLLFELQISKKNMKKKEIFCLKIAI